MLRSLLPQTFLRSLLQQEFNCRLHSAVIMETGVSEIIKGTEDIIVPPSRIGQAAYRCFEVQEGCNEMMSISADRTSAPNARPAFDA